MRDLKKVFIAFLVLTSSLCFAQEEFTSENHPKLKQKLRSNPELDLNKDGILTDAEYRKSKEDRRRQEGPRKITVPEGLDFIQNINYAGTGNPIQVLDITLPKKRSAEILPAIVYIHGGGWKGGDKGNSIRRLQPFIGEGEYVGFAINYRLSDEAKWPAQIHDCKAAIRWIKGHADKYGIDKDRIGVFGGSAGGHLVAMLALTSESGEFEGSVEKYTDENGSVACAIDGYGPAELLSMDARAGSMTHNDPGSPESRLIGGNIQDYKEKAINASPVSWVSDQCRPMLIYHGTADSKVIVEQSEVLHEKLIKAGAKDIYFIKIKGGPHGVRHETLTERMDLFFEKYLQGNESIVIDESNLDIDSQ